MERLVSVSRNFFVSLTEGQEKQSTPMAELVFVTIEQEYKPQLAKPLIEGGSPQFGLVKVPVAKTFRFTADKGALQMLLMEISETVGAMGADLSPTIDYVDPHEPGPEPTETTTKSGLVIVG